MTGENWDGHNRRINYLRISVTDRCNLRCTYCMPRRGIHWLDHGEVLTYEEIVRVVRAGVDLGIRKVRFTGGEPLVRLDVDGLVREVTKIPGLEEVSMTTNGVLLSGMAHRLAQAGLSAINVSLDTLEPQKYKAINGRDRFDDVRSGLDAVAASGIGRVKINTVVMRGVNDDELESIARLSLDHAYAVRFIEYMPIGRDNGWSLSRFMSTDEMKARLKGCGNLEPVDGSDLDGPSERFRFEGARGEIGFIGALSRHFCFSCNRLRLTSDGKLRPCLLSDLEVDVKAPLRSGCSCEELGELLRTAIVLKPSGHSGAGATQAGCLRNMSAIGG